MDIYITAVDTGLRLHLPLLPNKLNVKTGANVLSLNVIKTGEVKLPRGTALTGYSWSGTLPGASMSRLSFVVDWQDPKAIVALFEGWQTAGTKLNFMLTESTINDDVFVESFSYEYSGLDNIAYNITLTKYRALIVTTSPPPPSKSNETGGSGYPTGKITGKKVAYRKGPGNKYKKLGSLKKGKEVTIYETKGNWYKIKEGNPEWWVNASYVKITSGAPTKKKKSSSRKKKKGNGSVRGNGNNNTTPTDLTANVPTTKLVKVGNKLTKVTPQQAQRWAKPVS